MQETGPASGKILVTDDVHPLLLRGLNELGHVDYEPGISYEDTLERISSYKGIIVNSKILVNRDFVGKASNLRWVGRLGSGLDIIDFTATKSRGIQVVNSPEGNANAVGEHALGMLLSLFNNLCAGDRMVRSLEKWDRESMRGRELDGLTIGVIGFGHTGPAFVKKLQGFDVNVKVYDKYREHIPKIHRFQTSCDLDMLLSASDVVSLHVPLTDETSNMVDGHFLREMKSQSILINTSRGRIVDLEELSEHLVSGKLGGACLDVFENEKPETFDRRMTGIMSELSEMKNVILSPHVGGWTIESKRKIAEILLKRIKEADEK